MGIVCQGKICWGVGIDADIIKASIEALIVAVNKLDGIKTADICQDARMIEIMNYIQSNYIDVTLDDLSEKFYLSKPYLSKYIKEKSGVTFGDLVKKVRMKKAGDAKEQQYDCGKYRPDGRISERRAFQQII